MISIQKKIQILSPHCLQKETFLSLLASLEVKRTSSWQSYGLISTYTRQD
jgi:hypothetical protein